MGIHRNTLYEIRVFDAKNYFLTDSTKRYITKSSSASIEALLRYKLEDYGYPQALEFSEHYCYVFNGEFYTREQLLQSHPHLFV